MGAPKGTILVACDKFRGGATAAEVNAAIVAGLSRVWPDARYATRVIADGGEGTAEAVAAALDGEIITARVEGPLGDQVEGRMAWIASRRLAVIDVASASGHDALLGRGKDPDRASTFGTGELVRLALDRGATRIVVALGGSATVDLGTGLAEALGVRFLDASGAPVRRPAGRRLGLVAKVDRANVDPRLADVAFEAAVDVMNPLLGPKGVVRLFGRQKGVTEDAMDATEAAARAFLSVAFGRDAAREEAIDGAGAAGGVLVGMRLVSDARVVEGFPFLAEAASLADTVRGASLVVTGEGKLDAQSLLGKGPIGLARLARDAGVPVVALTGVVEVSPDALQREGIAVALPISQRPASLEEALAATIANLADAAERVARLIDLGGRLGP